MPYDQPYSPAPQPQPMGSPQDWTPADLHPDPTANQQLNHLAQLGVDPESFAALIKSITARATAPDPQMPQAPQPRSLSMWEATAAALHPELLSQFTRDPSANPQFQSQMAAFQQAMIGKRQATSDLLDLGRTAITANSRQSPQARGQIRVVSGPDGKPALQEFVPDGTGGFEPGKILATGVDTVKWLQGQSGYEGVASHTGQPTGGTVVPPGGMPVPAGIASNVASEEATVQGLDTIWGDYNKLRDETMGDNALMKWIKTRGVQNISVLSTQFPEYANYLASRQAALNKYVKQQTGAQFSEAEMRRYERMYPEPWDPPEVAKKKLDSLRQLVVADGQAKMRMFPGAAKGAPSVSGATANPTLERAKAIADWIKGGKVGPRP